MHIYSINGPECTNSRMKDKQNIARVQNWPDITILNSLFDLCISVNFLSFCQISVFLCLFVLSSFATNNCEYWEWPEAVFAVSKKDLLQKPYIYYNFSQILYIWTNNQIYIWLESWGSGQRRYLLVAKSFWCKATPWEELKLYKSDVM